MFRYVPSNLDSVVSTHVEQDTGNGIPVVASLNPGLSLIAVRPVFVAGVGVAERRYGVR